MPDIAMCANHECPLARRCYRHEAKPNGRRQVWAYFGPEEGGECDYFMELYETGYVTQKDDAV